LEAMMQLTSIDYTLALRELYEGVAGN
jgi:hypothetical protein